MLLRFHKNHPCMVSRFFLVAACAFIVYGGIAFAAVEIRDSQLESCANSNAGRLAGLRDSNKQATAAFGRMAVAEDNDEPAQISIAEAEMEGFQDRAESYMKIAERTGHQTTPGAVTVECSALNPEVLPWPG